MFSLICAWINGWVNNREAGDLRRRRVNYDVIVMVSIGVELAMERFMRITNKDMDISLQSIQIL